MMPPEGTAIQAKEMVETIRDWMAGVMSVSGLTLKILLRAETQGRRERIVKRVEKTGLLPHRTAGATWRLLFLPYSLTYFPAPLRLCAKTLFLIRG